MSNADRIEELRSKYEENPRRYFAPLANEYRKAGDLAQAIAICREHLPKQPGHMSGYIVYGQTLFEANNLEEARSVFEQALTLDPENLIALKHLGDIARMNGENGVARRWYARVLDADPRNDDIASQLASLGAPTPAVPVAAVSDAPAFPMPPLQEAVGVFATFDPSSLLDVPDDVTGIAGNNEFWSPPAPVQRTVQHHEPLDLEFPESPEPPADAAFEEGILAPEWPDTTELVARIVTPLRSATPLSVPATLDAVEAFGREASDEVVPINVDPAPQDEFVEAFLPPESATAATAALDMVELEASPTRASVHDVIAPDTEPLVGDDAKARTARETEAFPAFSDAFSEPLSVATFEPLSAVEDVDNTTEEFAVESSADDFAVESKAADFAVESRAADFAVDFAEDFASSAQEPLDAHVSVPIDTHVLVPSANESAATPASIAWAEPESVPVSEIEDFAFAAELPFEAEAVAEPVNSDLAITEEFAIPEHPSSGVYTAVNADEPSPETAADVSDESFADIFATQPTAQVPLEESFADVVPEQPAVDVHSDQPAVDVHSEQSFGEVLPEASFADVLSEQAVFEVPSEQSFAEISSELQSERDESDRADADLAQAEEEHTIGASADELSASITEASSSVLKHDTVNEVTPAALLSDESEKAQPFVTETMAELLVSQGFLARAVGVYEELVRRRPHDPVLSSRLSELREMELSQIPAVASTPTPRFNTPLANTPLRNTPLYSTPQFSAPVYHTPTYATPQSNTPLSSTPIDAPALVDNLSTSLNSSERHANERLQAFRTARERFAELARRRVARRTPAHATAVADEATEGLSSLFGTTAPATTDELAARALADAFGPVQDSGESLFDPAPTPTPAIAMRSLTPRANNTVQQSSATDYRSDRQPSADYSFDKFFPDPAMAGREAPRWPAPGASAPSSAHPVNEDLAQFSAWLKGLNNS